MKAFFIALLSFIYFNISAQSVKVDVSTDSILLGNTIKVTFIVENCEATFEAPEFDMPIVSGPNHSSSIQIMNGHKSSTQRISYFLQPATEGQFFIPPVKLIESNNILETEAIEINVYPNPDGIINNIEPDNNFFFESMEFPFNGFDSNDFWNNNKPKPQPQDNVGKNKKSKSNQKVRKI